MILTEQEIHLKLDFLCIQILDKNPEGIISELYSEIIDDIKNSTITVH